LVKLVGCAPGTFTLAAHQVPLRWLRTRYL